MGFNYRKSINLGKGIRVNLSKSGPSLSFGKTGMRLTVNAKGEAKGTVGIPGTGMYYNKQVNLLNTIKGWFGGGREEAEAEPQTERAVNTPETGKAGAAEGGVKVNRAVDKDLGEFRMLHRSADDAIDWEGVAKAQNELTEESKALKKLALGVLNGDDESYLTVIEEMNPFSDLTEYGSDFEVGMTVDDFLGVTFNVRIDEVVPTEVTTVLKSGKESVKPMTKTMRSALIRDYVTSVSFRVARDLFALLPVQQIVVNAEETMVNPATGHNEEMTLLSVIFPREVFQGLNFTGIVPHEALTNFEHAMDFKATKGLMPVLPLK